MQSFLQIVVFWNYFFGKGGNGFHSFNQNRIAPNKLQTEYSENVKTNYISAISRPKISYRTADRQYFFNKFNYLMLLFLVNVC